MSLTITKDITVNIIPNGSTTIIRTETQSLEHVYTVNGVNISGTTATANVRLSIGGVPLETVDFYQFTYSPEGGDITAQAEAYLLSLDEFSGAVSS
ncbi:hypothetical protein ACCY16_02225 [Candidatus Pantoea formicae]|uniref:hypothetical protein n=1 Tax=Candidatus Pantoea formicae TaxID=2608355 RepID=UPI003ED9BA63